MIRKIIIALFAFVMMFGCLVSCSDKNDEYPLVGTLDIEVRGISNDPYNDFTLAIYQLDYRTSPVKRVDFEHKNKVTVELNPGNYYIEIASENGVICSDCIQIQAGKKEVKQYKVGN